MRLLLVLLSCAAVALAAQKSYEGYKVYSVQLRNDAQMDAFMGLQKYEIDSWDSPNKLNKPFRVMVAPSMLNTFESFLGEHDIFSDIIIDNAQEALSREVKRNEDIISRNAISGRSDLTFDHYFRFSEITSFLQGLAAEHPNLITVESAGQSYQGRDLWVAKISNTGFDGSKPVIFIDANIHAREWIAVMSILNLIHELVDHADEYPEMYNVDWMLIPMANPDGYEFSHTDDRMWRKTMSTNNGSTCLGTDPNRNFNYFWEEATSTSDSPCSLIFRGPRPNSEVEVRIISDLLLANANRIKLYLAIHSYGDWLLYPYGYNYNIPNANTANLESLGQRVATAIHSVNSARTYVVGNSASALYPASGASDDFASGGAGIAYSYTVELSGGGSTGFDLEPEHIQQVSNEIFAGYREYAIWTAENF